MTQLNLGNAIFEGCNDKEGIMICGYEWGSSKSDQEQSEELEIDFSIPCTFSNKALRYGEKQKNGHMIIILKSGLLYGGTL